MKAAQLERLQEHLQRLRLFKSRERLEALLQDVTTKELSYADFLDSLLGEEVASKREKNVAMRTNLARFPFVKSLDAFDFTYQPSLDKKQVQTLATCHFIEHGENLLILGPPGVGKTHLAVGLGLKAIEHGYRVLFTTAAAMIAISWIGMFAAEAPGDPISGVPHTACRRKGALVTITSTRVACNSDSVRRLPPASSPKTSMSCSPPGIAP